MTEHSVIGLSDALKKYFQFRRLFNQLRKVAIERQPDVIICVDFSGFNRRFARAIKQYVRRRHGWFHAWNPKLVQYVSPQVWASRPGRAHQLAEDFDLLLTIFPFEKSWYAARVPKLRVEFVGHPMVERLRSAERGGRRAALPASPSSILHVPSSPQVLLLPGSRWDEVRRHWPIVTRAFELLRRELPDLRAKVVVPTDELAQAARTLGVPQDLAIQVGGVSDALAQADLAIAKSGTVTMECAMAGVPAVVFYRTSWPTYFAARLAANVKHIAMPNLLAGEEVFPEFVQAAASPDNIARAGLDLLRDRTRRKNIQMRLAEIAAALGEPGANARAAAAIVKLLET